MKISFLSTKKANTCPTLLKQLFALSLAALSLPAFASYPCSGSVGYLGLGGDGAVVVALNSTPIHVICNITAQGAYAMSVPSCKLAYAAILSAKQAGKNMTLYYDDNGMTCKTLPNWGAVPSTYFVQGPE